MRMKRQLKKMTDMKFLNHSDFPGKEKNLITRNIFRISIKQTDTSGTQRSADVHLKLNP